MEINYINTIIDLIKACQVHLTIYKTYHYESDGWCKNCQDTFEEIRNMYQKLLKASPPEPIIRRKKINGKSND